MWGGIVWLDMSLIQLSYMPGSCSQAKPGIHFRHVLSAHLATMRSKMGGLIDKSLKSRWHTEYHLSTFDCRVVLRLPYAEGEGLPLTFTGSWTKTERAARGRLRAPHSQCKRNPSWVHIIVHAHAESMEMHVAGTGLVHVVSQHHP